jgi:DNA polymerase IV
MSIMNLARTMQATQQLRWLYIDFNSYFASVEQELQPHLRGKPIIVVPVETDATCAIAASYEAKAYGIKTGTPVYEAKKICPGVICVLAKHEKYVEFHERIKREVDRHIPIDAVASIDEVACRLMNNETAPEKVVQIARNIKRGLAQNVGEFVKCSIGVAPNKYLAKVATDLQKPDGLTLLRAEDLPYALLNLKLSDLPGIGRNMERRLRRVGIINIPSLWAKSPQELRNAWGSVWGEKMWYYLRGVEIADEETTRRTIGHSHVMAPELRDPVQARFVARRLTLKAASRLRRIEYYAGAISLAVKLENGYRLEAGNRFFRAQDSLTLLHEMEILWRYLMREARGQRVRKASVVLHELVPATALKPELFEILPDLDLRARAKAEKISVALDKINQKFGRDSALLGMLPSQGKTFSGTKIAFTRVPDAIEFFE